MFYQHFLWLLETTPSRVYTEATWAILVHYDFFGMMDHFIDYEIENSSLN